MPHEALFADILLITYLDCMKYAIDCFVDGVWVQFNVGHSVHMMSPENKRRKVASSKINGVGVGISFMLRSFRRTVIHKGWQLKNRCADYEYGPRGH